MEDLKSLRTRLAREEDELQRSRNEIDACHRRVDELREHVDGLDQRIKLLREYIALAEAGGDADTEPAALETSAAFEAQLAAAAQDDPLAATPEVELGDLPNVLSPAPIRPRTKEKPSSFDDDIDERYLGDEILPRAETFEEALLFLMAHHRTRVKVQDIIRLFRRLEYSPEVTAAESIVERLEQHPAYFAHAGKDGFVLTAQGREEAERLLSRLAL